MNLLGIDYGTKNIGLAINNGSKIAFPFRVLQNQENIVDEIKDIYDEENIEKIILGLPTKRDRSEGTLAKEIKEFGKKLEKKGLIIKFEDELLSSSMVKEIMKNYEGKYEKDAVEASVILQTFINRHSNF